MQFLLDFNWMAIIKIVFLDILLGGDNAVVIALACSAVPVKDRSKALIGGTGAAILMRVVFLALAAFLIAIPFLKVVAGLMLLWIGFNLLRAEEDDDAEVKAKDKMWAAIGTIAVADAMMSIDNVFAVTGVAQETGPHGLMYAIIGVALSIPLIVFGASIITKFLDKFPVFVWAGGALLGWVGGEMIVSDKVMHPVIQDIYGNGLSVKIIAVLLILAAAWLYKDHVKANQTEVQNG